MAQGYQLALTNTLSWAILTEGNLKDTWEFDGSGGESVWAGLLQNTHTKSPEARGPQGRLERADGGPGWWGSVLLNTGFEAGRGRSPRLEGMQCLRKSLEF